LATGKIPILGILPAHKPKGRSDIDAQEDEYSGKKKHGIKNLTLCDDNQLILYLSATESGSMHDKAMADEYAV